MSRFSAKTTIFLLIITAAISWDVAPGVALAWGAEPVGFQPPRYQLNLKPEELPRPDSPGAKLVARFCGQCHSLPSPQIHQGNAWDRSLERMFWRMDSLHKQQKKSWWPWSDSKTVLVPTPDERELLVNYIKKNSLRPLRVIPESSTTAAELFKYSCTQCHVLPDPGLHSADEWPRTLEKMQKHLEKSIFGPLAPEEEDVILPYLQRNGRRLFGGTDLIRAFHPTEDPSS